MSTQVLSRQVPINEFVAGLRKFPDSAFGHADEIFDFLKRTPVSPETLDPYLTWDRQHYTRNLIDKTQLYELIAICWEFEKIISVHNHPDQTLWMCLPTGR